MKWSTLLDSFGKQLLEYLGESPFYLPTEYNPITRALKTDSQFVSKIENMDGFSRVAMSDVATLCQMVYFDAHGGPEGDGKPKALRRHWYVWFKTDFAQPFAFQIGDVTRNSQGIMEMNDLAWTQRLSQTYAKLVDSGKVTYRDLWVEDASRMMEKFWERLFAKLHVMICVEKDSLFSDFKDPARALGAVAVYSGKGKSSKAAIEKVLRDFFNWDDGYRDPFEADPLVVLHVSDYDFDGESVIGPTFAEQARRYTQNILEARIGVDPRDVADNGYAWNDKWYQVKVSNSGYRSWAENKALFMAQCIDCSKTWPVMGIYDNECPNCGGSAVTIDLEQDVPHGFEVESLTTRSYYGMLVDALLSVVPFDYIIRELRKECVANEYDAADQILRNVLANNESYAELLKEFDRLEEIKREFEERIKNEISEIGQNHISDWENDDDDPDPDDFRNWVKDATGYRGPWRPFSREVRTRSLVEWLKGEFSEMINGFKDEIINW